MTDYNDGNWHGWNGGKCPVHPESEIEALLIGPDMKSTRLRAPNAHQFYWSEGDGPEGHSVVAAFRVTKEHKEPREFWLGYNWQTYRSEADAADSFFAPGEKPIHVREVIK